MRNINKDFIKEYLEIKSEKTAKEKGLEKLRNGFVETEKALDEAQTKLREAEEAQRDNSLITIQQVEAAKKKALKAKDEVDSAQTVYDNLNTAISNAHTTLKEINTRELGASRKIWIEHSEIMLSEIRELVGDRIDCYLASVKKAYPEMNPHTLPTSFGVILKDTQKLKALQGTIQSEIFK